MSEFDEIVYKKNIDELKKELEFQLSLSNNERTSFIDYIEYCMRRLEREQHPYVYWCYD